MTLFEILNDTVRLGYKVSFSSFALQFEIKVERETVSGELFYKESALPLRDHFYEAKIVDVIKWSMAEIEKDINSNAL
jgi:hypothetical protein